MVGKGHEWEGRRHASAGRGRGSYLLWDLKSLSAAASDTKSGKGVLPCHCTPSRSDLRLLQDI